MYIRTSSFVSLETTFYIACIQQGFVDPKCNTPFANFVQSPIGLVPKAENQTRLIFHLSFDFDQEEMRSVNFYMPAEICMVKYQDLDEAIRQSFQLLQLLGESGILWYSKRDLKSAFRILGLSPSIFWLLVMRARNPDSNEMAYFVDKCLPFGASISCTHFQ